MTDADIIASLRAQLATLTQELEKVRESERIYRAGYEHYSEHAETMERQRDGARQERDDARAEAAHLRAAHHALLDDLDAARNEVRLLLAAHRSPSDAVRLAGVQRAEGVVRGWGM